jgi:hypothetical protein
MPDLAEQQETVRGALRQALESGALASYVPSLPSAEECLRKLKEQGAGYVVRLTEKMDAQAAPDLARCVLVRASAAALDEALKLRVSDSVKRLVLQHFADFANPPERWQGMFAPGSVRYQEMVKIVCFQRIPAGQHDWVVSYFPRGWVRDAGLRNGARLAACLLKMGGRGPLWEIHVNDRRPAPFLMRARDGHECYYRVAMSMQCQPEVKGVMCCAWFYSEELARVSPHLAWLRETFVQNGAIVADIGRAPESAGYMVGDLKRKELYERGEFHPVYSVVLWPKDALMDWAKRHPEFDKP